MAEQLCLAGSRDTHTQGFWGMTKVYMGLHRAREMVRYVNLLRREKPELGSKQAQTLTKVSLKLTDFAPKTFFRLICKPLQLNEANKTRGL